MQKKLALAAPMIIATCFVPAASDGASMHYSGNALFDGCNAYVRSDFPANVEPMVAAQGWTCFGIVTGVISMMLLHKDFCPMPDATTGQGLRVVNKYLQDHPSQLNESLPILSFAALRNAWPCYKH
jgi:hypothetical protein